MSLAYVEPSVSVAETTDPTISPLLAVSASVCLIGKSAGLIKRTDSITLTGTTAVTLPGVPTDATMASGSIISVMDALDPSIAPNGYVSTDDYVYNATNKTIARASSGSDIPSDNTVYVTYTYTPADYFLPVRMDNMADIQDRFGNAYNDAGTAINSPLTYAAGIAFENGASDVVLQPLFYNNSGTKVQPNDSQAAAVATWATNFVALRDIEDINVLVPVVGQSQASVGDAEQLAIIQALQDHIYFMATQGQAIMGIAGEDASASNSVAQPTTVQTHADTLRARYGGVVAENTVVVSPAKFTRALPALASTLPVGGQYAAAAVAGMLAARATSQSLTHKAISGFLSVAQARTKTERNVDASHGLCVIEQRGSIVRIRHGITLDNTSSVSREISIVRAKHRVIESVRSTMEEQIIGEVATDGDAPSLVKTAVGSVLEALRSDGDIVDYSDPQARTKSNDPTVVEVRFSYRPVIPINYVEIVFSLDLTSQEVDFTDTPSEVDE